MLPVADEVALELLGHFRVVLGGRPVDQWPSRRSAELVQLLGLAAEHRLTREQVIDALWPQLDAEAGGANLRKAAHFARQALGDQEAVALKGGRVALFPDRRITTDASRFEAEAHQALAADDPGRVAAALDLYRGPLLPDSLYEDWAQESRERLHSLWVELLREDGQWARVADLDPTDESACRELMRHELALGHRTAAIRWYGRLRSALRNELGLRPSPETDAVYDECVAGLDLGDTAFVGRQVELATGTAFLRRDDGFTDVLAVRGPGGIGKSALCRELARIAAAEGRVPVLVASTGDGEPYAPIIAAIEHVIATSPEAFSGLGERARSVLSRLSPLADSGTVLDHPPTRHETVGAVRRLLLAAGGAEGVLLVVDDVHLADEATVDLLLRLDSPGRQILLVLAYRGESAPDALTRGVVRWGRIGRAVELDLAPLTAADAAALVMGASDTPRDPEAVRRIVDLAEGNPFLAIEVARSPVAGVPSLTPTRREAVLTRMLELGTDDQALLERLALAGRGIDPACLVAVSGTSEETAFRSVEAALRSGVLVVDGTAYRFRHELVRTALEERVAPHARVVAHREMAAALAGVGAAPRLVARHWLAGGRPAQAAAWQLAAARQAVAVGAFGDALIELDQLLTADPRHEDALRLRAEALDAVGSPEAPSAYESAADVIGGGEAHDLRAKRALALIKRGDAPAALGVLAAVEPVSVEGKLAEALAHCGAAALGFTDPAVGSQKAAAARRLALQSGDSESLVVASWANAAAAHARGDLRRSVEIDLDETRALPRLATSVFDGQLCITQRLLYGARPYSDVIDFADSLASEADRLGATRGSAFAVTIRGEAKLLSGDIDGAASDLTLGADLHRAIGAVTGEAFALQRLAEVALHRHRPEEAAGLLDESLAIARESDVGFHLLDRIYGARVLLAGDPELALAAVEDAEEAVRGPIETCPGCRITLAVPAAIAAARAGDLGRADRWLEESEYLASIVMRLPAWDAALEEVRGHRAIADHDVERARGHFLAAATGFAEAGQRLDADRCAGLGEAPA